jgi:putative membrane protein
MSITTLALGGMLLTVPNAMAAEKDTLNTSEVSFIKHAASDDAAEVKLAELGAKKADRPDVKAFAEMLVTDHTQSNVELAKLAATKGVELSGVIEPSKAKVFQKLEQSSGTEFEKKFLAEMVSDHKMCVSNFEKASKESKDTDVKAFANALLPKLKAHLEKAKELSVVVKSSVK